jgi:hypothetical protein
MYNSGVMNLQGYGDVIFLITICAIANFKLSNFKSIQNSS